MCETSHMRRRLPVVVDEPNLKTALAHLKNLYKKLGGEPTDTQLADAPMLEAVTDVIEALGIHSSKLREWCGRDISGKIRTLCEIFQPERDSKTILASLRTHK